MEYYEGQTGESIEGQVNLILTDAPYNTRREQKKNNYGHDELSDGTMQDFAHLLEQVLSPSGHGVILCSNLEFSRWFRYIDRQKEYVQEDDPEDPDAEDSITVQKKVFRSSS